MAHKTNDTRESPGISIVVSNENCANLMITGPQFHLIK